MDGRRSVRWGVGLGVGALALIAATQPYAPRSTAAPMDELVVVAEDAPSVGVEAAVRTALDARPYIDALSGTVTWDLPSARNERVDFWIDFLEGRNAERTRVWLERQGRWAPLIRTQLRERGMPEDLLYLAMIESGLSPYAYSRAHASGMWQFIAETGRRYGLRIDGYVDERRDPIASTDAALDYLQDMHDDFGSWFLAAAGYNSGENRVARLLRQKAGGATGDEGLYWVIGPHLPRETRDYVPLMLAAGHIAKQPEQYGFRGLVYQDPFDFVEVEVPGGTSLASVARAGDLDKDVLEDLNPHLVRDVTPPGESWKLRVPRGSDARVAANLARILEEEPDPVEYVLRRGETLSHLASRYGVSVDAISAANGGVNPRRLQAGQRLVIPVSGSHVQLASASTAQPSWQTHRVRRGDTLWGIARRYDVSIGQLRAWNSLGRSSRIQPGQSIRVRSS